MTQREFAQKVLLRRCQNQSGSDRVAAATRKAVIHHKIRVFCYQCGAGRYRFRF